MPVLTHVTTVLLDGAAIACDSKQVSSFHDHDCPACTFVGKHNETDLYFCVTGSPSLVARYGDDGPEYSSISIDTYVKLQRHKNANAIHDSLDECFARVMDLGLYV